MKKYIIILMILSSLNSMAMNLKVFIPRNDIFTFNEMDVKDKGIDDVLQELGHVKGTYYEWYADDGSYIICYKIFSSNISDILCIFAEAHNSDIITKEQVQKILLDNNYDYKDAYSVDQQEEDLNNGIAGKYLTQTFMEEVTRKKASNNRIEDDLNEYIYFFQNGIMVSYKSSDGLVGFAKESKGSPIFHAIELNAKRYFKTEEAVIEEINKQFSYYTKINIDYLPLGNSDKYNYNYALLYVDLYRPAITMAEFIKIVHQQAEVLSIKPEQTTLKYNFNYYVFDKNAYSGDSRSPIPMISVHSVGYLLYRRQS